jgi:hypothetical protein
VTYIGLAASLKDKQVIDNTATFFNTTLPVLLDPNGNVQSGRRKYTFKGNDFPTGMFRYVSNRTPVKNPSLKSIYPYSLAFGSPKVRLDLVHANINTTGTLNARTEEVRHSVSTFSEIRKRGSFDNVKVVGLLDEFDFLSRNNEVCVTH